MIDVNGSLCRPNNSLNGEDVEDVVGPLNEAGRRRAAMRPAFWKLLRDAPGITGPGGCPELSAPRTR